MRDLSLKTLKTTLILALLLSSLGALPNPVWTPLSIPTARASPALENFTSWTESDASNRLSQTSSRSTWTSMNRLDDNVNLYVDKGAGSPLKSWVYEFDLNLTSIAISATQIYRVNPLSFANETNDFVYFITEDIDSLHLVVQSNNVANQYQIYGWEVDGATDYGYQVDALIKDDWYEFSTGTEYYWTFNKTGLSLDIKVYSDSGRITQIANCSGTLNDPHNYRYVMAPTSCDYASGDWTSSGYIENLELTITTPPSPITITNQAVNPDPYNAYNETYFWLNASATSSNSTSDFATLRLDLDPTGLNLSIQYEWSTTTFSELNDPSGFLTMGDSVQVDLSSVDVRVAFNISLSNTITKHGPYNVKIVSKSTSDTSDSDTLTSVFQLYEWQAGSLKWFSESLNINFTETGGQNLVDVPMLIDLYDTDFNFTLAQSDLDDIRFTEDDGTTFLTHWIEEREAKYTYGLHPALETTPVWTVMSGGAINPGAYAFEDAVYFGYLKYYTADMGNLTVAKYNLTSGAFSTHVFGTGDSGHEVPLVVVNSTGHIHVIYNCKGANPDYASSVNPHDITSWTLSEITVAGSNYGNIAMTKHKGADRIIFLHSSGAVTKIIEYFYSDDAGATWTGPISLVDFTDSADPATVTVCPGEFIGTYGAINGSLHLTYIDCESIETTPYSYRDLFYMYSDDAGATWKKRDGSAITLPVNRASSDKIRDSGTNFLWSFDMDLDSGGLPHIAFREWTDASTGVIYEKYARWESSAWEITTLGDTYVGGHPSMWLRSMLYVEDDGDIIAGYEVHQNSYASGGFFEASDPDSHIYKSVDGGDNFYKEGIVVDWGEFCTLERVVNTTDSGIQFYNQELSFHTGGNTSRVGGGKVWVKIPELNASSRITIICQYGNSTVTDASYGEGVFSFFDDFEDNQLNTIKWTDSSDAGAEITETGGYLELHSPASASTKALIHTSTGLTGDFIAKTKFYNYMNESGTSFETGLIDLLDNATGEKGGLTFRYDPSSTEMVLIERDSAGAQVQNTTVSRQLKGLIPYVAEIDLNSSEANGFIKMTHNFNENETLTLSLGTDYTDTETLELGLYTDATSHLVKSRFEWVFLAKSSDVSLGFSEYFSLFENTRWFASEYVKYESNVTQDHRLGYSDAGDMFGASYLWSNSTKHPKFYLPSTEIEPNATTYYRARIYNKTDGSLIATDSIRNFSKPIIAGVGNLVGWDYDEQAYNDPTYRTREILSWIDADNTFYLINATSESGHTTNATTYISSDLTVWSLQGYTLDLSGVPSGWRALPKIATIFEHDGQYYAIAGLQDGSVYRSALFQDASDFVEMVYQGFITENVYGTANFRIYSSWYNSTDSKWYALIGGANSTKGSWDHVWLAKSSDLNFTGDTITPYLYQDNDWSGWATSHVYPPAGVWMDDTFFGLSCGVDVENATWVFDTDVVFGESPNALNVSSYYTNSTYADAYMKTTVGINTGHHPFIANKDGLFYATCNEFDGGRESNILIFGGFWANETVEVDPGFYQQYHYTSVPSKAEYDAIYEINFFSWINGANFTITDFQPARALHYNISTTALAGEIAYYAPDPYSDMAYSSHGSHWAIWVDTQGDIWLLNASEPDPSTWAGREIYDTEVVSNAGGYGYYFSLHGTQDSEGDIHLAWHEVGSNVRYAKIVLENDGVYDAKPPQLVVASANLCIDIMVDAQDYPVVMFRFSSPTRMLVEGTTTKNGTWTEDYSIMVNNPSNIGEFIPVGTDQGKDFLVVYVKTDEEYYSKAFDESGETFGSEVTVDTTRQRKSDGDSSPAEWANWNLPNAIDRNYTSDGTGFFTWYGWDEDLSEVNLAIMRTTDSGATWDSKVIYSVPDHTDTDWIDGIIRFDSSENLYVFFRTDDLYPGQHTFFYDKLNSGGTFGSTWNVDDHEMFSFPGLYSGGLEGAKAWSIVRSGLSADVIDKGLILFDEDELLIWIGAENTPTTTFTVSGTAGDTIYVNIKDFSTETQYLHRDNSSGIDVYTINGTSSGALKTLTPGGSGSNDFAFNSALTGSGTPSNNAPTRGTYMINGLEGRSLFADGVTWYPIYLTASDADGASEISNVRFGMLVGSVWCNASYNPTTDVWTKLGDSSMDLNPASDSDSGTEKTVRAFLRFSPATSDTYNVVIYERVTDNSSATSGWGSISGTPSAFDIIHRASSDGDGGGNGGTVDDDGTDGNETDDDDYPDENWYCIVENLEFFDHDELVIICLYLGIQYGKWDTKDDLIARIMEYCTNPPDCEDGDCLDPCELTYDERVDLYLQLKDMTIPQLRSYCNDNNIPFKTWRTQRPYIVLIFYVGFGCPPPYIFYNDDIDGDGIDNDDDPDIDGDGIDNDDDDDPYGDTEPDPDDWDGDGDDNWVDPDMFDPTRTSLGSKFEDIETSPQASWIRTNGYLFIFLIIFLAFLYSQLRKKDKPGRRGESLVTKGGEYVGRLGRWLFRVR